MFAHTKSLQAPLMFIMVGLLVLSLLSGANTTLSQTVIGSDGTSFSPILSPQATEKEENDVLILMYHMLSGSVPSTAFIITPEAFEADIRALKEEGYTFCKAKDLEKEPKSPTEKRVAITFDDGYESDYTLALPILEKYDACATFFVVGSMVGTPGYLTEEQLYALAQSDAAQVGNHSFSYHHRPYEEVCAMYEETPDAVLNDFARNQAYLREATKRNVTACSFPYGVYNETVASALTKQGLTLLSSDEKSAQISPYGRFNRPFDLTLHEVIERANRLR